MVEQFLQEGSFTVNYKFLEKVITFEGIEEGMLSFKDFVKITHIDHDEDSEQVTFECDIYRHKDH